MKNGGLESEKELRCEGSCQERRERNEREEKGLRDLIRYAQNFCTEIIN